MKILRSPKLFHRIGCRFFLFAQAVPAECFIRKTNCIQTYRPEKTGNFCAENTKNETGPLPGSNVHWRPVSQTRRTLTHRKTTGRLDLNRRSGNSFRSSRKNTIRSRSWSISTAARSFLKNSRSKNGSRFPRRNSHPPTAHLNGMCSTRSFRMGTEPNGFFFLFHKFSRSPVILTAVSVQERPAKDPGANVPSSHLQESPHSPPCRK